MGGLGNQMFQVAAAYAHAVENGGALGVFEKTHILPYQGFKFNKYAKSVFRKVDVIEELPEFPCYNEPDFRYVKIPQEDNLIINGYFQSEKYFSSYGKDIKELYSIPAHLSEYIFKKYPNIPDSSVSVHVRRGDYVKLQEHHALQSLEYYRRALKVIGGKPQVYVFSDDLQWCENNLGFGDHFIDEQDDACLYMMSLCMDNILANSSFSWWAAWLNENLNKKVIAPHRWFGPQSQNNTADLIPAAWVTI